MREMEAVATLETTLYEVLRYPETIWDKDLQVFALRDSVGTVISVGQEVGFWPRGEHDTGRASRFVASPLGHYLLERLSETLYWPVTVFCTPEGMSSDALEQRLLEHYRPHFNGLAASTHGGLRSLTPLSRQSAPERRCGRIRARADMPVPLCAVLSDEATAWAAGWRWLQHAWTSLLADW